MQLHLASNYLLLSLAAMVILVGLLTQTVFTVVSDSGSPEP
ncbi:MAG: hypothetical protein AAFQ76_17670 [Cyanobacteria bacterium J06626_26]